VTGAQSSASTYKCNLIDFLDVTLVNNKNTLVFLFLGSKVNFTNS